MHLDENRTIDKRTMTLGRFALRLVPEESAGTISFNVSYWSVGMETTQSVQDDNFQCLLLENISSGSMFVSEAKS